MKSKSIVFVAIFVVVVVIGFGLMEATRPVPLAFQGQVEAKEVDVAAKVPGRVVVVRVREGDVVAAGDVLVELASPELTAKLDQATAAREAAVAMQEKAESGARDEEIRMARFEWARANSAAELAETTFRRFETLYKAGLIAAQKRDEVATNAVAAGDEARAARAQFDMLTNGTRPEDRAAAAALVDEADGRVAEASAYRAETLLTAPIAGELSSVLIDVGELAPVGFPIVTLVDLSDVWVVLNVREDHLANFKMDAAVVGSVPALNDRLINLSVFYIAPLADFATWRATRYSSGYDIKTFEVRLRASEAVQGLRPGMSVLIDE